MEILNAGTPIEGMTCPVCGHKEGFLIKAETFFHVTTEGVNSHDDQLKKYPGMSDVEWDGSNYCVCPNCDFGSTVKEFRTNNIRFKIWFNIEAQGEKGNVDLTEFGILPDSSEAFDSIEEAIETYRKLPICDPWNSDALKIGNNSEEVHDLHKQILEHLDEL